MVAAGIANLKHGEIGNGRKVEPLIGGSKTEEAAKQMNVGRGTVERAKAVKDKGAPGLADMVRDGKVSVRI